MLNTHATATTDTEALVWPVGALCRAVGDALQARFNPVLVQGEIGSFSQASSGHCYFTLKDEIGQLRCAMFRRTASALTSLPRDGDHVQVRARLAVYEARGELQLVVEGLTKLGQGGLLERFMQTKERLAREGLFDAGRKRSVPAVPRHIGVVTSLQAAALADVLTALKRRAGHVRVTVAPALVQGVGASPDIVRALGSLASLHRRDPLDAILLVRGGGSLEDLWAFNEEAVVRAVVACPVPVISGVGHETDFTLTDFAADLRAPTPTAAAELVAADRQALLNGLNALAARLHGARQRGLDWRGQQLDGLARRLRQLPQAIHEGQARLTQHERHLTQLLKHRVAHETQRMANLQQRLLLASARGVDGERHRLLHAQQVLHSLDPQRVVERGYAWLADARGQPVTKAVHTRLDQSLQVHLQDGQIEVRVTGQALGLI